MAKIKRKHPTQFEANPPAAREGPLTENTRISPTVSETFTNNTLPLNHSWSLHMFPHERDLYANICRHSRAGASRLQRYAACISAAALKPPALNWRERKPTYLTNGRYFIYFHKWCNFGGYWYNWIWLLYVPVYIVYTSSRSWQNLPSFRSK